MVGSASGMVAGGFLARDPERCERVVGVGMGLAACIALWMALGPVPGWAVPVLFGVMGLVTGSAGPSRDMLVKRSTPANASGRVFGVVYSGLDIGQALAPLLFGRLMDLQQYSAVWIGLAAVQARADHQRLPGAPGAARRCVRRWPPDDNRAPASRPSNPPTDRPLFASRHP